MIINMFSYSKIKQLYNIKVFNKYYLHKFKNSKTIYIGNLSYYTNEKQLYEFFNNINKPKRIIIGLDRSTKNPCGFCFLDFYKFKDAKFAYDLMSGSKINKRILKIDLDKGYTNFRQYGRNKKEKQMNGKILLCNKIKKVTKCYCNSIHLFI